MFTVRLNRLLLLRRPQRERRLHRPAPRTSEYPFAFTSVG